MTADTKRRATKIAILTSTALALTACATPGLDRRIATLNQNIATERQVIAPLAAPYRGREGQDVQFDLTGRPIEDTLEAFNNLGFGDRTMTIMSYDYSGYIAQSWTKCWPFNSKIGFEVVPAFNQAFAGVIHIDHIDHSWNANDGLAFRIKNTLGAAAFIVGGKTEFCGISATIPIGAAVVVLGTASSTGSTSLDTPSGDSLVYHVRLTQPIYLIADVVTPVFAAPVPMWFKFEITKGKIPTTLGQSGIIQVTPAGQQRRYTLNIRLDQAAFLPAGLTASGKVDVNWQPTIRIAPSSASGAAPKGGDSSLSAIPPVASTGAAPPSSALIDTQPKPVSGPSTATPAITGTTTADAAAGR